MNILDTPQTETDKKIAEKQRINKQLKEDIEAFEELPKDLKCIGWILEKNTLRIPFYIGIDDTQYYFSIMASINSRNKIAYSYAYETTDQTTKEFYKVSQTIIKEKFINIQDNDRNKQLEEYLEHIENLNIFGWEIIILNF